MDAEAPAMVYVQALIVNERLMSLEVASQMPHQPVVGCVVVSTVEEGAVRIAEAHETLVGWGTDVSARQREKEPIAADCTAVSNLTVFVPRNRRKAMIPKWPSAA